MYVSLEPGSLIFSPYSPLKSLVPGYMYACMHACMHACVRACVYVCIDVHSSLGTFPLSWSWYFLASIACYFSFSFPLPTLCLRRKLKPAKLKSEDTIFFIQRESIRVGFKANRVVFSLLWKVITVCFGVMFAEVITTK